MVSHRRPKPRPGPERAARPDDTTNDPGISFIFPALVSALGTILAASAVSSLAQRSGRETVWADGGTETAVELASGNEYPARRVDRSELPKLANKQFAPPEGLTAWQGGIVYADAVRPAHLVAWLFERAVAGEVEIEGEGRDLTLRLNKVDSTEEQETLSRLFAGSDTIKLGSYDASFASRWEELEDQLTSWYKDSPYWDSGSQKRKVVTRWLGYPLAALGVVLTAFGAILVDFGPGCLIAVAIGAILFGGGSAMVIRSWELRTRTPEGSDLWIRTESFRHYLGSLDRADVQTAVQQNKVGEYTAWAIALGETSRWSKTIAEVDEVKGSEIGVSAADNETEAADGAVAADAAVAEAAGVAARGNAHSESETFAPNVVGLRATG